MAMLKLLVTQKLLKNLILKNVVRKDQYLKNYRVKNSLNCSFKNKFIQLKSKQTKLLKYGSNTYNNRTQYKQTIEQLNAQFEKDHNCTQVKTLIAKYGQDWRSLNLPTLNRGHNAHFVLNKYITLIANYENSIRSKPEQYLYDTLSTLYNGTILHNTRKIILKYELDIYIPDLKLAIEYNGTYWHSIQRKNSINYHLNKSILCREKGIRLIHIYEFEDFTEQLNKLTLLLQGTDLYNSRDFNKNNIDSVNIPQAEIIYQDKYYTIYGSGKLY